MIAFLAAMAAIGALSSLARLVVSILDYRRRWVRDPAELYRRRK